MSNTFAPTQKYNRAEYINEKTPLLRDEDYKPYAANECAFSVERKGSFKVIASWRRRVGLPGDQGFASVVLTPSRASLAPT